MGRTARRSSEPHLPPVEKIELSSAHKGPRLAAALLLLAVGAAALAFAFTQLFTAQSGWQEIKASDSAEASCKDDFTLLYELGADGASASAEKKALDMLYSEAAVTAYRLFTNDSLFADTHNMRYINDHPNETIAVDPALYDAFAQVEASGNRTLYLGPVYELYDGLFFCQEDWQTADFDPAQNADLKAFFARCAAYGADPSAVQLELLGDGQVRLAVSEEYLAFARQEEIEDFIDFGWMKNAFIADYLADTLIDHDFTNGALSSFDGFVRNLDQRETVLGFNIFDLTSSGPIPAAVMQYAGQMSIVSLRDHPVSEADARRMYTFADGHVLTAYLDPADALEKTAAHDLTGYSRDMGCGALALKLAGVYVAEKLDGDALAALAGEGVYTVHCEGRTVVYTDSDITLSDFYDQDGVTYSGRTVG